MRERLQGISQIFGMLPDRISHTKFHGERRQRGLSIESIDCLVELCRARFIELQSPHSLDIGGKICFGFVLVSNKRAVVGWIRPGLVMGIEVGLQRYDGL